MSNGIDFPEARMIGVNGIELEVFEAGTQNIGNPIVLCHGWPEHAFSWRYQIPVLVEAGYHVIVPNQRGYGNSSCPDNVEAYDIAQLSGDLIALLDHFGYKDAVFAGHDWGSMVVWGLALLHPERVSRLINLSVPYQERGNVPWLDFLEAILGADNYFVHFNKKPGVADAVFEANTFQFLTNLFRKNLPIAEPEPGMALIKLAKQTQPEGDALMSDAELAVFVSAFEKSGFTGGINWYRNLNRNWHILGDVNPIIEKPALMIYGEKDTVQKSPNLSTFVPHVDEVSLDCGHWIQQEKPDELNAILLEWLKK